MDIYIRLDSFEMEDVAEPVAGAIAAWVKGGNTSGQLIDVREGEADTWQVGLRLTVGKKATLRKPLDFFYQLAKQEACEFAIGIFDDAGGQEDVCFFGQEEGRPDIDEVVHYIGLYD